MSHDLFDRLAKNDEKINFLTESLTKQIKTYQ
jgi:hypothetical protein